MKVFIFDCAIYCADCGKLVIDEQIRPHYPKVMTPDQLEQFHEYVKDCWVDSGEADYPEHCESGRECVNAFEVNGQKFGAWLENDLTDDGREYIRERIRNRDGDLWEYWAQVYSEQIGLRVVG